MSLNFRPKQSFCKKDYKNEINNKFESYINTRDTNKDLNQPSKTCENNITKKEKIEYNKEDFLKEFITLHNDIYFNPYKILNIDKNYTPESLKQHYKKLALENHPDKGGDSEIFKDITQSYIYLLKKYKENIPDKQIEELKEGFNDFMNQPKKKNILMKDNNFNLDSFNNFFENNVSSQTRGHEDFMKSGVKEKKETYVFSDKFNLSIFNKLFNKNIKKQDTNQIQIYKEPTTLFQSTAGYSELGGDEVDDFTSGFTFNQKIHFTDCKRAYSEPEELLDSQMGSFNSLDDLEKHRSKISYKMNNEDIEKYNKYLEEQQLKDKQKQIKIERSDLNILKKYNKYNNILLEN